MGAGECYQNPACVEISEAIQNAVDAAFADGGLRSCEFGGSDGTEAIALRVMAALNG